MVGSSTTSTVVFTDSVSYVVGLRCHHAAKHVDVERFASRTTRRLPAIRRQMPVPADRRVCISLSRGMLTVIASALADFGTDYDLAASRQ